MIAQNIFSGKKNVVEVYLETLDLSLSYEVQIKSKGLCIPVATVDVDNVSFCSNIAKFSFVPPCLDGGEYSMTIRDKGQIENVILNQNALV